MFGFGKGKRHRDFLFAQFFYIARANLVLANSSAPLKLCQGYIWTQRHQTLSDKKQFHSIQLRYSSRTQTQGNKEYFLSSANLHVAGKVLHLMRHLSCHSVHVSSSKQVIFLHCIMGQFGLIFIRISRECMFVD